MEPGGPPAPPARPAPGDISSSLQGRTRRNICKDKMQKPLPIPCWHDEFGAEKLLTKTIYFLISTATCFPTTHLQKSSQTLASWG